MTAEHCQFAVSQGLAQYHIIHAIKSLSHKSQRFGMTTPDTAAKQTKTGERFRLPDPPEREPNDRTSFNQLSANGNAYHLKQYLIGQRPRQA